MKRMMRQLISLILVVTCCTGVVGNAFAAERLSFYLTTYMANVSAVGDGDVEVSFNVGGNQTAAEIGAKYILLEESSDGGRTWSIAKEYEDESWMSTTNRATYAAGIIYHGTEGYRYRVTVTVFAYNSPLAQDSRTVGPSSWVTA